MMKNLTTLITIVITQLCIGQSISTDAPSISAGATTVGEGIFQIESRIQYSDFKGIQSLQLPSSLFRLGIGNKFELRMSNAIRLTKGSSSLSGLSFGLKTQLLNKPDGKTQIAFLFDAPLPNFEGKYYSGTGTFAVNHSINENNSIGYNAGFTYSTSGQVESRIEWHAVNFSLIYSNALTSKLSLFTEFYGGYVNQTTFETGNTYVNFDCGFLYLINDKFQFDYSYGIGIIDNYTFHAVGFNFMIGRK